MWKLFCLLSKFGNAKRKSCSVWKRLRIWLLPTPDFCKRLLQTLLTTFRCSWMFLDKKPFASTTSGSHFRGTSFYLETDSSFSLLHETQKWLICQVSFYFQLDHSFILNWESSSLVYWCVSRDFQLNIIDTNWKYTHGYVNKSNEAK